MNSAAWPAGAPRRPPGRPACPCSGNLSLSPSPGSSRALNALWATPWAGAPSVSLSFPSARLQVHTADGAGFSEQQPHPGRSGLDTSGHRVRDNRGHVLRAPCAPAPNSPQGWTNTLISGHTAAPDLATCSSIHRKRSWCLSPGPSQRLGWGRSYRATSHQFLSGLPHATPHPPHRAPGSSSRPSASSVPTAMSPIGTSHLCRFPLTHLQDKIHAASESPPGIRPPN